MEQVNLPSQDTLTPDTEKAHNEQMINVADGKAPAKQDETNTEKLYMGKYKTPEDMEAAFKSLQGEYTKLKQGKPEEKPAEGNKLNIDNTPSTDDAQKAVEKAGLDINALEAEFAKDGQLSEKTYTDLEKAGIPKVMVDAYIAGQQALQTQFQNKVFESVGGEANYRAMTEWAKANLPADQINAFNTAITGDANQAMLAIQGLHAMYSKSEGAPPKGLLSGTNATHVSGYESRAQMIADMSDPRYGKDEAFRAQVYARIKASKIM